MSKRWWKFNLLALVFILGVALVITGCGGTQQKSDQTGSSGSSSTSSSSNSSGSSTSSSSNSSGGSTSSEPKEDLAFYDGKTVNFIVATKAGGGYDTYGRLIAPYIQKYLSGSTVLVKNVPGAGHIIGANEIYNSKPDGLTLGTFNKGLIMSQIAGLEGIKFDMAKFTWLGNASSQSRVLVVRSDLPYKSMEEMAKAGYELKVASAGVGSTSYSDAMMLSKMFGFKIKMISGYQGQQADLAIMKGEIDGQVAGYDSMQALFDQKEVKALVVIGNGPIKDLPDVPMLSDIVPADFKAAAELMNSQASLARPIAATPGLPPERALALRNALKKALEDPELLDKAAKAKLQIDYLNGEKVAQQIAEALDQPPDFAEMVKEVVAADK